MSSKTCILPWSQAPTDGWNQVIDPLPQALRGKAHLLSPLDLSRSSAQRKSAPCQWRKKSFGLWMCLSRMPFDDLWCTLLIVSSFAPYTSDRFSSTPARLKDSRLWPWCTCTCAEPRCNCFLSATTNCNCLMSSFQLFDVFFLGCCSCLPEQDVHFVGRAAAAGSSPSEAEEDQAHGRAENRRKWREVWLLRHPHKRWSRWTVTWALSRRMKHLDKRSLNESLQFFWSVDSGVLTFATHQVQHWKFPVEVSRHFDRGRLLLRGDRLSKRRRPPWPHDPSWQTQQQVEETEQIGRPEGSESPPSQQRNWIWRYLLDPFWLGWVP